MSSDQTEELEPPTFRLPENPDRFELWTVRLPRNVDLQELHGCHVDVNLSSSRQPEVPTFKNTNGKKCTFQFGDPIENESFRLLLPKEIDEDAMEDDDERFLYPSNMSFRRHVRIAPTIGKTGELDVAPSTENAPEPVDPMRHAYASVPQKKGLKRRWVPMGATPIIEPRQERLSAVKKEEIGNGHGKDESAKKKPRKNGEKRTKSEEISKAKTGDQLVIKHDDDAVVKDEDKDADKKKAKKARKKEKKAKKEKKKHR